MEELAYDEVGDEEYKCEDEEDKATDEGEPLVIVEVFALEVRHPVELGHRWRLFTNYNNTKPNLPVNYVNR